LPYAHDRKCAYRSIFGIIEINRAYYQAKETAGVFPLESEINLPERGYSYFLQEISSKLAVNGSYEKACEVFGDIFPVRIPIRSLERIVGDACEDVAQYYEEKPAPELPPEAVITVATVDKKGVVIRKPPSEETSVEACADPNQLLKDELSDIKQTLLVYSLTETSTRITHRSAVQKRLWRVFKLDDIAARC
jgi:hypothetical protein